VLAEAPGYHEVMDGRPLVGIAGREFDSIVQEVGGKRDDLNYLNSCSCRPTKVIDGKTYNRTPDDAEIAACNDRLINEIEIISPLVIVAMGKVAYVALTGDTKPNMKEIVGSTFIFKNKYNVIVTYHPAAIAHSGGASTARGKQYRNEIKEAIKSALATKHTDKQLPLFEMKPTIDPDRSLILVEMDLTRQRCNRWWDSLAKCGNCKQKFYCHQ
jgi:DNA polymerase